MKNNRNIVNAPSNGTERVRKSPIIIVHKAALNPNNNASLINESGRDTTYRVSLFIIANKHNTIIVVNFVPNIIYSNISVGFIYYLIMINIRKKNKYLFLIYVPCTKFFISFILFSLRSSKYK